MLLSKTGSAYADYVMIDLIGDRVEVGVGNVYFLLADYVFDSKGIAINTVLHRDCTEDQKYGTGSN